ncbi:zinc finger, CCHC-type containing protein [Tanacetum coccineum]
MYPNISSLLNDLCDLHATPSLGNKKYVVTFIDDASRFCYVYLLHSKDETLDKFKVFKTKVELQQGSLIKRFRTDRGSERGIETIFVRYAEHSKAYRFYVIEPNDSVAINSIIELRDAIFDEHRFSSVPRQSEPELRKSKRHRTPKDFGPEFQLYLIEGTRDEVSDQPSYCFNVEDDPKTFDEAIKLQTSSLQMDLQKKDEVTRISTIRLLIAMASIHNLIIHHMYVKIDFLNRELEEEVYMNQPLGFILLGNENKVCKLIKSLYGLKQAPNKFDASGKGVIICLYVNDMLIFGTDQVQVDLTKEFLSSRFSMKDMGEADVILGIRIKHKSNGIAISQSHYIEKVLKKFNYFDCTPVSTPLDTCEKLMPNRGVAVTQLEYSRVIGCLMYAMTCTRPDIAFSVGKLSRYTSNPGTQHWQAIQMVLKYLTKTMDYRPVYSGYPSVLEGYTDASWINNTEDNSSTSDWVFLLGGGAISWASKKQTCITDSATESEFVALAAAGKEAKWLKNLPLEIPLWVKPLTPISIYCDSAATLAKAYSRCTM